MENVVLVIHLFLALLIIGLVLLQRSEGGGLGIGSGGGMGSFASARGTANALSRMTAICAAAFFGTSLLLGILASNSAGDRQGILEALENKPAGAEQAIEESRQEPEEGGAPSAPLAE